MAARGYRLGHRQAAVDGTRASILAAAQKLVSGGPAASVSVGAVARRAAVSRITVYNHFGSRAGLLAALVPRPGTVSQGHDPDPVRDLRARLAASCAVWSADPALYRNLPGANRAGDDDWSKRLAERLAAADRLRPGCSIKEAQDVIGLLSSFAVFDALYGDGRRPLASVVEILARLAAAVIASEDRDDTRPALA